MRTNRRDCLKTMLTLGAGVGAASAWPNRLAANMRLTGTGRHLIVLWMPGGPSQMDTFDLKPGHTNGGPFQELTTSVPGLRFSEHLPRLGKLAKHLALVRSMHTKEGDHSRGTYLIRTGQRPGAPLRYPALPAALAKELAVGSRGRPGYVSISPNSLINPPAFSSGFLGTSQEPLTVSGPAAAAPGQTAEQNPEPLENPVNLRVENLVPPEDLPPERIQRRREFWDLLQHSFGAPARNGPVATHDTVYRRAMQLAESELVDAFDLERESDKTRRRYGNTAFGQGCLMARRLIEFGVPVVEVALSSGPGGLSWDSHTDNFATVQRLSQELDRGWSQLLLDLDSRGLLENTTIAWMGEFGRTPRINQQGGRDHFPDAWTCVLSGGGIQGGSIWGKTGPDGMEVVEDPVSAADFLSTLCMAVGVDPGTENYSADGRPIKIAEGQPIAQLLS